MEAENVARKTEEIEMIKRDAEEQLAKAKPHLEKAEQIVNSLNKDDITDLKSTKQPTEHVMLALKCVLLYLQYDKPDWPKAQRAMADIKFLDKLKTYNKDNIP